MRYVSLGQIKPGMILANDFYGSKFEILLTRGMTLSQNHIRRINDLGYAGVYIEDPDSEDVVVRDVIPAQLRLKTIRAVKELVEEARHYAQNPGSAPPKSARVSEEQQQRLIMPLIQALIEAPRRMVDVINLKPYEYYDFYHASNVVVISLLVGLQLGLSGNHLHELGLAALLHDVGNAFVPKIILDKPGELTPHEYETVQAHAKRGFEYLRDAHDLSIEACLGALHHHEHYDGSGYPTGLKGNKISIYGRIIATADVFDAMVSRRPYHDLMMPAEAMEVLEMRSGSLFDPSIIDAFGQVVCPYPAGAIVQLSSGVACIVVENFPQHVRRPRVRMLKTFSATPMYIDLWEDQFEDIEITGLLEEL